MRVYISKLVRVVLAIHLSLPVFVYESVEGHAVLPAGGEVSDIDVGIPAGEKNSQGDVIDGGAPVLNQCLGSARQHKYYQQHISLSSRLSR